MVLTGAHMSIDNLPEETLCRASKAFAGLKERADCSNRVHSVQGRDGPFLSSAQLKGYLYYYSQEGTAF